MNSAPTMRFALACTFALTALCSCGGGSGGQDVASTDTDVGTATGTEGATNTGDSTDATGSGTGSDETGVDQDDPCAVGEMVFDESAVHELTLQLSDADWAAMIQEAVQSPEYGGPDKTYFNAAFQFDGVALPSEVAVRLKGHSSLLFAAQEGHAFPLKLDFDRVDASQTLDGLNKLNVHTNLDGITIVNEYLSYGAIRAHGVPTARLGFARVTVNGEELGVYSLVEHMQGKFIRCNYAEAYGDLYKPEEPIGNLAWQGPNISDYEPEIQFKWPGESVTNHASILNLLDVVNNQGVAAFEPVLDIPGVLTYLAMNAGVGNFDYYASFGHNYYLYESTPGRFTMLPWDMNFSQFPLTSPCGFGRNTEEWPVSNKLLGDPAHVQEYLAVLESFLRGAASPAALGQRLDTILPLLGSDVDPAAVQELRETMQLRTDSQLQVIAAGLQSCPEFAEFGGDECDSCIDESCGSDVTDCFADRDCGCVLGCVANEGAEADCLTECGVAMPPALYDAVIGCIEGQCGKACE